MQFPACALPTKAPPPVAAPWPPPQLGTGGRGIAEGLPESAFDRPSFDELMALLRVAPCQPGWVEGKGWRLTVCQTTLLLRVLRLYGFSPQPNFSPLKALTIWRQIFIRYAPIIRTVVRGQQARLGYQGLTDEKKRHSDALARQAAGSLGRLNEIERRYCEAVAVQHASGAREAAELLFPLPENLHERRGLERRGQFKLRQLCAG